MWFFVFDKFTLQNLADKSDGVETSLLYFLYITYEVNSTIRCSLFIVQTSDSWIGLFFIFHNFARQIALIQLSRRSKDALTLAQQIIEVNHYKTFSWRKYHDVGTIQWDQFALCIMQGNNGLLAKTFKKSLVFLFNFKIHLHG